jgi:hypothetical protein
MKAALCVCTLLFLATCKTTPGTAVPPRELAGNGYFIQKDSYGKGIYGPVYIFPEVHNSRLIQAKIAWALDVLKEQRGINTIALEGMYKGEIMNSEKVPYSTEKEQYTVQLALFERGEIRAPELMYLVNNSLVSGIENKEEHDVELSEAAEKAIFQFVASSIIADKGRETYNKGAESYIKKEIDLDTFLSLNPWTVETYKIIYEGESTAKINKRLEELEEKTKNWLDAQTAADFKQAKEFYKTAFKRSITMASHVHSVLQKKNEPLVMIIGANHSEDITEYFKANSVNYYVFNPTGLFDDNTWSYLTSTEYKQKEAGLPVLNESPRNFFTNSRAPGITVDKDWFKKEQNFFLLVSRMLDLAKSRKNPENQNQSYFTSGGLRLIQQNINLSNPVDIKLTMQDERGRSMYVRAIPNPQKKPFGSFRKALAEIIERLSLLNEKNLPIEQRIKAFGDVIEAFNLDDYTVFISPSDELFNIDLSTLS